MKQVSYKIAKALKEAGYPQNANCDKYITKPCKGRYLWYTSESNDDVWYDFEPGEYIDHEMYGVSVANSVNAPTYIDAWLWLWREKKITIDINANIRDRVGASILLGNSNRVHKFIDASDPEEAIKKSIEYLVDNDLIK